ncbi:hypothetical protein ZIOFF_037119 [Zingiber officinale]|uniref:Uncharacterized protein n=1 Tax=Zingiber officinale TaxID=94328 RepID=A0A8J5GJK9_ZINOF|nr:hypothetical protein ZIOFF_037119 [Zingiber officinale]
MTEFGPSLINSLIHALQHSVFAATTISETRAIYAVVIAPEFRSSQPFNHLLVRNSKIWNQVSNLFISASLLSRMKEDNGSNLVPSLGAALYQKNHRKIERRKSAAGKRTRSFTAKDICMFCDCKHSTLHPKINFSTSTEFCISGVTGLLLLSSPHRVTIFFYRRRGVTDEEAGDKEAVSAGCSRGIGMMKFTAAAREPIDVVSAIDKCSKRFRNWLIQNFPMSDNKGTNKRDCNVRVRDMGNRRALRHIRNLVGEPPYVCAISKNSKSGLHEHNTTYIARRPMTRDIGKQTTSFSEDVSYYY